MTNEVSWDFPEGVDKAADKAARTTAAANPELYLDREDYLHDALIWAATHGPTIAHDLADPEKGLPYINWRMRGHLSKLADRARRGSADESVEVLAELEVL